MPFAVVLTRPSCYFYLRLSRLRAWKGVSGNALCPVATLRYIANLQAPNALRQGIPALLYERSPASLSLSFVVIHSGMSLAEWTTLVPSPGICLQWRC